MLDFTHLVYHLKKPGCQTSEVCEKLLEPGMYQRDFGSLPDSLRSNFLQVTTLKRWAASFARTHSPAPKIADGNCNHYAPCPGQPISGFLQGCQPLRAPALESWGWFHPQVVASTNVGPLSFCWLFFGGEEGGRGTPESDAMALHVLRLPALF